MKKVLLVIIINLIFSFSVNASTLRKISFNDVELSTVANVVSQFTKVNFSYGEDVAHKKISLFVSVGSSNSDILKAFFDAISSNGFSVLPSGNRFFKIISQSNKNSSFNKYAIFDLGSSDALLFLKSIKSILNKKTRVSLLTKHSIIAYGRPEFLLLLKRAVNYFYKNNDKIITRVVSFYSLSPKVVKSVFGAKNVVYSKNTKKYLVSLPKHKFHKLYMKLLKLDDKPKSFTLKMIIASISLDALKNKGLSFLINSNGLSFDNLKQFLTFSSNSSVNSFSLIYNFLNSSSNAVIISRPFMQIEVGKSVLFKTGQVVPFLESSVSQSTGQVIQNVKRKNVGLNIKASLENVFNSLELNINESFSSLKNSNISNSGQLITNNQTINSTLRVKPNLVYSLGGAISSSNLSKNDGVNLFFDIPVSSQNKKSKSQLFVFFILKPVLNKINNSPFFDD